MTFYKGLKENSSLGGIRLQLFSNEDLDAIHSASMHLLGNTGLKVENQEAVQIYGDNGCAVKDLGECWLVKLPQNLVEDCIRFAPSSVVAWGRDRQHDFVMEPDRIGFMPIGECLNVIDPRTRKYRPLVKKDVVNWSKVIDTLDGLDLIHNPGHCSDVPGKTAVLHSLEAMLTHTKKHICLTTLGGAEELNAMLQMCRAVVGEEEFRERPCLTIKGLIVEHEAKLKKCEGCL
jgi:trimethylamine--corrinoid protein Co-methyltransferase